MRSAKSVAECHTDRINKAFAHYAGHRKLQSRDTVGRLCSVAWQSYARLRHFPGM